MWNPGIGALNGDNSKFHMTGKLCRRYSKKNQGRYSDMTVESQLSLHFEKDDISLAVVILIDSNNNYYVSGTMRAVIGWFSRP